MNDFRSIYAIRAKSIKQVIQSIDFRKKICETIFETFAVATASNSVNFLLQFFAE